MSKKIKLALIGCGGIVENEHLPALLELNQRVKIEIIVDPSEKRRNLIGNKIKVPSHKRFADINTAQWQDIDIGVIATPHQAHFQMAETLMNRNISVVLEKPPVTSLNQLEKLKEISQISGSRIFVVHNYKYNPIFSSALAITDKGDIGDVFMFRAHLYDPAHFPGVEEFDADWRTKKNLAGGGCFMDNGYHYLYLSMMLISSPVIKIAAYMNTIQPSIDVEDLALVSLFHENGALTSLHCSWCVQGGGSHAIEIYGTRGTIKINEEENEVLIYLKEEEKWKRVEIQKINYHYVGFYKDVLDEFIHSRGQAGTRVFPREAADVMALLDRIYENRKNLPAGG